MRQLRLQSKSTASAPIVARLIVISIPLSSQLSATAQLLQVRSIALAGLPPGFA
jgi:hypothetical protein